MCSIDISAVWTLINRPSLAFPRLHSEAWRIINSPNPSTRSGECHSSHSSEGWISITWTQLLIAKGLACQRSANSARWCCALTLTCLVSERPARSALTMHEKRPKRSKGGLETVEALCLWRYDYRVIVWQFEKGERENMHWDGYWDTDRQSKTCIADPRHSWDLAKLFSLCRKVLQGF